jgi:hypothetical protein
MKNPTYLKMAMWAETCSETQWKPTYNKAARRRRHNLQYPLYILCWITDEMERISNGAVMAYRYYLNIWMKRLSKTTKISSQDK